MTTDSVLRPPLHLGVVAIEKGAFGLPSTTVANFLFFTYMIGRWKSNEGVWVLSLEKRFVSLWERERERERERKRERERDRERERERELVGQECTE